METSFDRRNPFIVLNNIRKMRDNKRTPEQSLEYISAEGYSAEELDKVPIPKNLNMIATALVTVEKTGKVLANTPGFAGELVRNANLVKSLGPMAGQIAGNIVGGAAGAPGGPAGIAIGSKVGGTVGATMGEAASQAIKVMRGETVSAKDAFREIIHTGTIAGASEMMFGAGSPGGKLLEKTFSKLAKLGEKHFPGIVGKIAQATSGKVTPDDVKDLIRKNPSVVLAEKNIGTSIDPSVITRAMSGMEHIKSAAQNEYGDMIAPLIRDKNLISLTQPIVDDFAHTLGIDAFGFVDDSFQARASYLTGTFGIKEKEAKKLLQVFDEIKFQMVSKKKVIVNDVPSGLLSSSGTPLTKSVKSVLKVKEKQLRKYSTFSELLLLREDIGSAVSFSKMDVKPISSKFEGALKTLQHKITETLQDIGGQAFKDTDSEYAAFRNLYDSLQKILKTSEHAEMALENVIKGSRQQRLFKFVDLDNRLPSHLKFMDDLENFALAHKFRNEGFNLLRAGIIGTMFNVPSMAAMGPAGAPVGLAAAYFGTTPKGIGLTIKAADQMTRELSKQLANLQKVGGSVNPVATTALLKSLLSESKQSQAQRQRR